MKKPRKVDFSGLFIKTVYIKVNPSGQISNYLIQDFEEIMRAVKSGEFS
jgi:hypothetical protein